MNSGEGRQTLEHTALDQRSAGAPVRLGATLVRLVNADDPLAPSARYRLDAVSEAGLGRAAVAAARTEGRVLSIGLEDPYASSQHTTLRRDGPQWSVHDEGSRNGTFVDGERLAPGEVRPLGAEAILEVGRTFFHFRADSVGAKDTLRLAAPGKRDEAEPSTFNTAWEFELGRIFRLAGSLPAVLLQGESGAGKEVLARELHAQSGRPGPLVAVNCGALAESLLEDELFGHVRGAFSGAVEGREGLIRAAHRGTLFLDEVGEMPASLQVKLLRVLEDHRVRPLGADRDVEVDVRVIAASHQDLWERSGRGAFRTDLLARLGLQPVRVPAVRERREDLGLLVRNLLRASVARPERVRFELEALRAVLLYDWPLNVRELRQALLAAVELAAASPGARAEALAILHQHHLPRAVSQPERQPALRPAEPEPPLTPAEQEERERLVLLLGRHSGNVAAVARELGAARTNVQRRMSRLGLTRTGPVAAAGAAGKRDRDG